MRRASFIAGLGLLALVWLGPLLTAWRDSVAAHMLAHMGVVALAAPLLALGLADRLPVALPGVFPLLPGTRKRSSSLFLRNSGRKTAAHFSWNCSGAAPVIASLVEFVVVWGWHAPAARLWAETSTLGTVAEQLSFLGAGLFLWLSCLAGSHDSLSRATGAFALLLTSMHMTLLGALMALSPRPLYGMDDVTCFGTQLSASLDQQFGAVIMLGVGGAVYLAGGVSLLAGILSARRRGAG